MPHKYRCSLCREIITPDEVAEHMNFHKNQPDWPGHMSYTMVGGPFDTEEEDAE